MNATDTAHYLQITPTGSYGFLIASYRDRTVPNYALSEELVSLLRQWGRQSHLSDGLLSGVLADYLEDHWEELMVSDPTADAVALSRLIEDFRTKFNDRSRHNG